MSEQSISFLVNDIARLLRRRFQTSIAGSGLGLSLGEARALAYVRRKPGLRQSQIAEFLCVEPMTVVGYLDRLEKRGLIERRPDPCDRRAKLVSLTEAAAPAVAAIDTAIATVRQSALADFSQDDVKRIFSLLQDIQTNLYSADTQEAAKYDASLA